VVAWSQPAEQSVRTFTGVAPLRLSAGSDHDRISGAVQARAATRQALHIGPEVALVVYAGRLAHDKGVALLIRSAERLDDTQVVIAGDGPARAELESLAADLRLQARVRFLGFVADPLRLLAAADATVLMSSRAGEGRPLSVIEAASVGTPVVGSVRSSALKALKALEAEGLIAALADERPESVAAALRSCLQQPRQTIAIPSWAQVAAQLEDAMQIGQPNAAPTLNRGLGR
jgi:glycosyltransferase involved in cell wall biosynthesis